MLAKDLVDFAMRNRDKIAQILIAQKSFIMNCWLKTNKIMQTVKRLLKAAMLLALLAGFGRCFEYDGIVSDRISYAETSVTSAAIQVIQKGDKHSIYLALKTGEELHMIQTEIAAVNNSLSNSSGRLGKYKQKSSWMTQVQFPCDSISVVDDDTVFIAGYSQGSGHLHVTQFSPTQGVVSELAIPPGEATFSTIQDLLWLESGQCLYIVTFSKTLIRLDYSEVDTQVNFLTLSGDATIMNIATVKKAGSATEIHLLCVDDEEKISIQKIQPETSKIVTMSHPLQQSQNKINSKKGALFATVEQALPNQQLYISVAVSSDGKLILAVTRAMASFQDQNTFAYAFSPPSSSESQTAQEGSPEGSSSMPQNSASSNSDSQTTSQSAGEPESGQSAFTPSASGGGSTEEEDSSADDSTCFLNQAWLYCRDSQGGRRLSSLSTEQSESSLLLISQISRDITLLELQQLDTIGENWCLYLLVDGQNLVRVDVKISIIGNSINIDDTRETTHRFNYAFIPKSASRSFSATKSGDILLSILSNSDFAGEPTARQQLYILSSLALRPSPQDTFWSTSLSVLSRFTKSSYQETFKDAPELSLAQSVQNGPKLLKKFMVQPAIHGTKFWVPDPTVGAPVSEKWDKIDQIVVVDKLELLITYTDDQSAMNAGLLASLGPEALTFELDPSHLLKNRFFLESENPDYQRLLYNESYAVLTCDSQGNVESDVAFEASQYSIEGRRPDQQTRTIYQIPIGATKHNCYIITDAYEELGTGTLIATANASSLRIWIKSSDSSAGASVGQTGFQAKSFAASLEEQHGLGLQEEPPSHVEARIGQATTVRLGKPKSKDYSVEVLLGRASDFILFDVDSNVLLIEKGALTEANTGTYTVKVAVSGHDSSQEPSQRLYEIKFAIIPSSQNSQSLQNKRENESFVEKKNKLLPYQEQSNVEADKRSSGISLQDSKQKDLKNDSLVVKLSQVEIDGRFSIHFSKQILWPDDIEQQLANLAISATQRLLGEDRKKNILSHEPLDELIQASVKFDAESDSPFETAYTWAVNSVEPRGVHCSLLFDEPYLVSQGFQLDTLTINLNLSQFMDESLKPVAKVSLKTAIPRQLSTSEAQAISTGAQATQVVSTAILCSSFFVNLALAASLSQLWSMLNGLQLAVHLPLFDLAFPANANFTIQFIIQVATFDLVPPELILAVFTFPKGDPFSDAFDSTGYSSMYPVENLGTCWLLVQIYILLVVLWLILSLLGVRWPDCPRVARVRNRIGRFAFWGAALRFCFQGYLELCLSVFIGWYQMDWQHESLSVLYSNLFTCTFTVILVALPVWLSGFFFWCRDKLEQPLYRNKYGTLYEDLDLSTGQVKGDMRCSSLFFNVLFVIRRLVFALSAIYLERDYVVVQVAIQFFSSVLVVGYLHWCKPFKSGKMARVETFNEGTEILLLYHLQLFTQFVPDPQQRYQAGWSFIIVLAFYMAVHFTILLNGSIRNACLSYRKFKVKQKAKQGINARQSTQRKYQERRQSAQNQPEPVAVIEIVGRGQPLDVIPEDPAEHLETKNQGKAKKQVLKKQKKEQSNQNAKQAQVGCHSPRIMVESQLAETAREGSPSLIRNREKQKVTPSLLGNSERLTAELNSLTEVGLRFNQLAEKYEQKSAKIVLQSSVISQRRVQKLPKQQKSILAPEGQALAKTVELLVGTQSLLKQQKRQSLDDSNLGISLESTQQLVRDSLLFKDSSWTPASSRFTANLHLRNQSQLDRLHLSISSDEEDYREGQIQSSFTPTPLSGPNKLIMTCEPITQTHEASPTQKTWQGKVTKRESLFDDVRVSRGGN